MENIKQLAVATDTAIAELQLESWKIIGKIESANNRIFQFSSAKYVIGARKYNITLDEAIAEVEEKPYAKQILIDRDFAITQLSAVQKEISKLNEVFKTYKWNRAYLVTNTNGHVHSSMDCSSCFVSTTFSWRTEYSGSSEFDIVEAAGDLACTICYPSAPVETLKRPSAFTAVERAAAQAAKAEREAKKAARVAKQIASSPSGDGAPLTVIYGEGIYDKETFRTERSAMIWAVDEIAWSKNGLSPMRQAAIAKIAEAIATKRQVTVEKVYEEIQTKAGKRK